MHKVIQVEEEKKKIDSYFSNLKNSKSLEEIKDILINMKKSIEKSKELSFLLVNEFSQLKKYLELQGKESEFNWIFNFEFLMILAKQTNSTEITSYFKEILSLKNEEKTDYFFGAIISEKAYKYLELNYLLFRPDIFNNITSRYTCLALLDSAIATKSKQMEIDVISEIFHRKEILSTHLHIINNIFHNEPLTKLKEELFDSVFKLASVHKSYDFYNEVDNLLSNDKSLILYALKKKDRELSKFVLKTKAFKNTNEKSNYSISENIYKNALKKDEYYYFLAENLHLEMQNPREYFSKALELSENEKGHVFSSICYNALENLNDVGFFHDAMSEINEYYKAGKTKGIAKIIGKIFAFGINDELSILQKAELFLFFSNFDNKIIKSNFPRFDSANFLQLLENDQQSREFILESLSSVFENIIKREKITKEESLDYHLAITEFIDDYLKTKATNKEKNTLKIILDKELKNPKFELGARYILLLINNS